MENDLLKALKEANTELSDVIAKGKTSDILSHPAFKKMTDAMSGIKKGGEAAWNAGCINVGCATPELDKLKKVSQPGQ